MLKLIERTTMLKPESGSEDSQKLLSQDPDSRLDESTYFNIEFRRQVFLFVVRRIRDCFNKTTWQAFWQTYIEEQSPQHAADCLAISVGAVYIARSRVMNRLQAEIKILVDDNWHEFRSGSTIYEARPVISEIRDASIGEQDL